MNRFHRWIYKLPLRLRNRIWATYRAGQEIDKRPSESYLAVAMEVQEWIRSQASPGDQHER